MKIQKSNSANGSILLIVFATTAIIGLALAGYLSLASAQNRSTMRSQTWNSSIPMVEAGIEEALAHLNGNRMEGINRDGWNWNASLRVHQKQRTLGDCYYTVTISTNAPDSMLQPGILCEGYVPSPLSAATMPWLLANVGETSTSFSAGGSPRYVSRKVSVRTRLDALFSKALAADGQIDIKGNNIETDSFDSTDPLASTGGRYDIAKRRAKGDVATNSELISSLSVGNGDIRGKVSTGPGGSVSVGSQGTVGDLAWVSGGNRGIQPGWGSDDMNVDFPPVDPPFNGGAQSPQRRVRATNEVITIGAGGVVTSSQIAATYEYYLENGNYHVSHLIGSIFVKGHATLYVTHEFDTGLLRLAPNSSIKLFVAAPSAAFRGNDAINTGGKALNVQYYGLPGNTSIAFSGNASFTGTIYAPNAHLSLSGGGNNRYDFVGATVSKTATLNGHFNFHYDESLARIGPDRGYVVTSWNEDIATAR